MNSLILLQSTIAVSETMPEYGVKPFSPSGKFFLFFTLVVLPFINGIPFVSFFFPRGPSNEWPYYGTALSEKESRYDMSQSRIFFFFFFCLPQVWPMFGDN